LQQLIRHHFLHIIISASNYCKQEAQLSLRNHASTAHYTGDHWRLHCSVERTRTFNVTTGLPCAVVETLNPVQGSCKIITYDTIQWTAYGSLLASCGNFVSKILI